MTTHSVEELRRAVAALDSGAFRLAPAAEGAVSAWHPSSDAAVVVGVLPRAGASTVALALAEAADRPVHLLEAGPSHRSTLAVASTAELGEVDREWRRSSRGDVLIDRLSMSPRVPDDVGEPPSVSGRLTVLDAGWELSSLVRDDHWLSRSLMSLPVVLVATASGPGLRALDGAMSELVGADVVAALVIGPPPRRWGWPLKVASSTPAISGLRESGRLFSMPFDPGLAAAGVTSDPLPTALARSAVQVLDLLAHDEKEPA